MHCTEKSAEFNINSLLLIELDVNMALTLVYIGFVLKIIHIRGKNFSRVDVYKVFGASLFLLTVILIITLFPDTPTFTLDLILASSEIYFPLAFFVIALGYIHILIPKVNEGHGLLFSTLAYYLYYEMNGELLNLESFWQSLLGLILLFQTVLFAVICLSHKKIRKKLKPFLLGLIILASAYIGASLLLIQPSLERFPFEYLILGFVYLEILSSLIYLRIIFDPHFIANQFKENSDDGMQELGELLEEKYIDSDVHRGKTLLIILIGMLLFSNSIYNWLNWFTLFSFLVLISNLWLLPIKIPTYAPRSSY
jgi:hypothetical protein